MQEVETFAYGRVNLIGEHTDYNGGWVLPTAIPQKTSVVLKARSDFEVHVKTAMSGGKSAQYLLGEERKQNSWIDYIQGASFLLRKQGCKIQGFDLSIDSNVPAGSGLSSSAALEISVLKALNQVFNLGLNAVEMAKLGQGIENKFVGAQVGIMDQMACSLAKFGEALFLDTKTLQSESIHIPMDKLDLVVVNSGLSHQNANGDYNQRRAECEKACALLGIQELRELKIADLARLAKLPELLGRRARHVVTENHRVHQAVKALRDNELQGLGLLFKESHRSMRDDYEVSIPEIDLLVDLFSQQETCLGARLTGGGFGGSVVAITKVGEGLKTAHRVLSLYHERVSHRGTILVPELVLA